MLREGFAHEPDGAFADFGTESLSLCHFGSLSSKGLSDNPGAVHHRDLQYDEGQRPIVHLSTSLDRVLAWAEEKGNAWAFTQQNAAAAYAVFDNDPAALDELDWDAIADPDFRPAYVKEAKQAEFLVRDYFPLHLVEEVGVVDLSVATRVEELLEGSSHKPVVRIRRDWYY